MKLKDYKGNLTGVKVKTPKGVVGYWKSQWGSFEGKAGVWLSDGSSDRVYPQFLDSLKDALEWEIVDEKVKVNCYKKTGMEFIDLCKEKQEG